MKDIQDIFNRIRDTKRELKNLSALYRDTLASAPDYKEIKEQLEQLRARKKQVETAAWLEVGGQDKAEELKTSIKQDQELLTDIALTNYIKGEKIMVVDEANNEYEPIFKVSFKKSNEINQQSQQ